MYKLSKINDVQQLRQKNFSIAAIARKCGISRNTVYKYLNQDIESAVEWVADQKTRRKKLDPYRDVILGWLKTHPDMSAAQVADWLQEQYYVIHIGGSTVRTYVRTLREVEKIPKTMNPRQYEAVPESPPGKQAQVDFGEIRVPKRDGGTIKLYAVAFVLSHSRYKYIEWQQTPFRTQDVIRCHENAFEYYGGIPEEMVYDQDKLMTVSENAGDIIFTTGFQSYRHERGFSIYLCRKADPESKGKVENVVKYAKYNFAKHRTFYSLDRWNEETIAWLARTANHKEHETIKKRPDTVFALEKQHLRQTELSFVNDNEYTAIITRTVHKNNTVKYLSNRYTVPTGTYQAHADNTVYIEIDQNQIKINRTADGPMIATHPLNGQRGQLIRDPKHGKTGSEKVKLYQQYIRSQFDDKKKINGFMTQLAHRYPRYLPDQLRIIKTVIETESPFINQALDQCIESGLWSANDFRDVTAHLSKVHAYTYPKFQCTRRPVSSDISAEERSLDTYVTILGGDTYD